MNKVRLYPEKPVYLASAYSNPDKLIEKQNWLRALDCTAWMLSNNIHVFSPIVHCHPIAIEYSVPGNFDFWERYDRAMIGSAGELWVLDDQEGYWQASKGVTAEMKIATDLLKPMYTIWRLKDGSYDWDRYC